MKTRLSLLAVALAITGLPMTSVAQTRAPVPRPFPGAPAPPASTTPAPAPPGESATPTSGQPAAPQPAPRIGPELPGVPPVYPTAEYLEAIDAGAGQTYHLYGTAAPFDEIVAYYRTVLRERGREIYETPGTHQFELGRFDDDRMVYPPSVVVKDYSGGAAPGYLFVSGTEEKRFATIIQVVPPEDRER